MLMPTRSPTAIAEQRSYDLAPFPPDTDPTPRMISSSEATWPLEGNLGARTLQINASTCRRPDSRRFPSSMKASPDLR
jgi:hypothetical protein